jgi:hypothetical protein
VLRRALTLNFQIVIDIRSPKYLNRFRRGCHKAASLIQDAENRREPVLILMRL